MVTRLSTLGYALLTLLARESLSGYELARHMKTPIGFFWQAQLSQIYPELARLEQLNYVFHQVVVQEDRPSKKLYTLTEPGRAALKAWTTQPPQPTLERNELLLKTYAIWVADPQAALDLFRACEKAHRDQLALFEEIQTSIERKSEGILHPDDPRFGDYATVRMGVAYEREYVLWCQWMIQQFERVLLPSQRDLQEEQAKGPFIPS
ncbi:MAG: PadR family transcriptional regulator [Ktedonobacteraceae bacterium]|nr:PadR family transcriptional regulator [Ktedonobacteraceae bacterium]